MKDSIEIGRGRMKSLDAMQQGASVLWLVRSGNASDWTSLCRWFGLTPDDFRSRTAKNCLWDTVEALERAHLLIVDRHGKLHDPSDATLSVAASWNQIQSALGFSLTDLAQYTRGRSLVVNPWFGVDHRQVPDLDVFVAMPFLPELKPIYDNHICSVARALNLSVARADDFFGATAVISDVWAAISSARLVIADCTGRNPNVFYEMGIAHTLGKPVVLITQRREDVPFDIQHIRYIQYEYPYGMQELESRLTQTLINELEIETSPREAVR